MDKMNKQRADKDNQSVQQSRNAVNDWGNPGWVPSFGYEQVIANQPAMMMAQRSGHFGQDGNQHGGNARKRTPSPGELGRLNDQMHDLSINQPYIPHVKSRKAGKAGTNAKKAEKV